MTDLVQHAWMLWRLPGENVVDGNNEDEDEDKGDGDGGANANEYEGAE